MHASPFNMFIIFHVLHCKLFVHLCISAVLLHVLLLIC